VNGWQRWTWPLSTKTGTLTRRGNRATAETFGPTECQCGGLPKIGASGGAGYSGSIAPFIHPLCWPMSRSRRAEYAEGNRDGVTCGWTWPEWLGLAFLRTGLQHRDAPPSAGRDRDPREGPQDTLAMVIRPKDQAPDTKWRSSKATVQAFAAKSACSPALGDIIAPQKT